MSSVSCTQCAKQERDRDHRHCPCGCHEHPGERERIAYHVHQFEHGCYGHHCPEAYRLYGAWQATAAARHSGGYR